MLTEAEIQKLAKLSRLEVKTEDVIGLQEHFAKMLSHMENLKECDVTGLEPLTTVDDKAGFVREDEIKKSLSREESFLNAPSVDQHHFAIPKVIG